MAVVVLQNVTKQFGTQVVLDGVSLDLHAGQTVGLVGVNGAGKTTLFRLMTGEFEPDHGEVTVGRGVQIGYLRQEPAILAERTLLEEVGSAFDELLRMELDLQKLSEEIAERHDGPDGADLMTRYDRLHTRFLTAGGETFETRLHEILHGLGFSKDEYSRPMALLSGGQRCRAALAKLLLEEKPFLLLDEPTNHLDIDAVRWLEKFLEGHKGGAVVISHDRYLLDRLCDRIVEVARRNVTSYTGNYSTYVETKAMQELTRKRQFEKDSAFITKQRDYIAKHLAGQRSQQAKGRRTRLNRQLDAGELVTERAGKHRLAKIAFGEGRSINDAVVRCEDLRMGFGGDDLFGDMSFQIRGGQRFGITGPNGTGKTTLLKIIAGELAPLSGRVELARSIRVGYYSQDTRALDSSRTLVDEIRAARPAFNEHDARSYLARFLFHGDDVFKPLGSLSGGEQSRVRLGTLILQQPDLLILDEPTNHLDIPSREVLEEALDEFGGTVLAVSHDRYFLDRIVERLLVIRPEGHRVYDGSYSFYLQQVEGERVTASARSKPTSSAKSAARATKVHRKTPAAFDRFSIEQLEKQIMDKEVKLAALQERFGDPEVCRDPERLGELEEEVEAVNAELAALNAAWHERLEAQGS